MTKSSKGVPQGRSASRARRNRRYRLEPVSMGAALGGRDLDKALELAARLEDEEIVRQLQQQE